MWKEEHEQIRALSAEMDDAMGLSTHSVRSQLADVWAVAQPERHVEFEAVVPTEHAWMSMTPPRCFGDITDAGALDVSTEVAFTELVATWRRETAALSSKSRMVLHPAYQRIIGLGQGAVPLLLRELNRSPDHFSWALRAITGKNPVPADAAGDIDKAAKAWLDWARRESIRW